MSQHQYLAAFRRYWYVVVVATIVGTLGGWGLSQVATPVYTATSSLYFSLNFGGSANDLNQGSTYTQNQMLSFAQLAVSPLVLNPVIDELGLDTTPKALSDAIGVSTPQNTVILELSVSNTDPAQAAKIANAVSASLGEKVEQIAPKSVGGGTTVAVRVIQPASAPTDPSSPNTRLNLVAGLVLGLLLGSLIVVLRELLDTRVHSAAIATAVTGVPLLGTADREKRRAVGPVVLRDPLSNAAENYRQLRSNLEFVAVDSDTLGFVVTSSVPGEGKSLIALNLALALAEGGRKVLLVDADLRRPMVAAYTGLPGEAGLTSVLVGRATAADVVQTWGDTGLKVLASGPIPPNPSELLSSRAMAELVDSLVHEYEVVVFDTAPMVAVADAAILARMLDGALLVADRTRVHRPQLAQTMDSLEKSGVRVLGLVLNRSTPAKDRHAYYYRPQEPTKPWWRRMFSRRSMVPPVAVTPVAPVAPLVAPAVAITADAVAADALTADALTADALTADALTKAAQKAAPLKAAPQKAAPQEDAPQEDAPQEDAPQEDATVALDALELEFPEEEPQADPADVDDSPLDDEFEDDLGDPTMDDDELLEPANAGTTAKRELPDRPKQTKK
ncbi:polysaccharide biosynthesis tyrosine autokinase [Leifsonia poae]|uniref:polysaccharide biosynthesis tyrosine autokinase n=1 Tax=Leifsonia poae TaxID=110933 RepID=UPI001CBC8D55|nr:polysaccharide biosynthesis tyrosine autokinase [Leifsonia poae]